MSKRLRFVGNETRTLPLSDGDWLLVKERLNIGDVRDEFARRYEIPENATRPRLNVQMVGFSQVVAYLIDWSLDHPIRGLPADELLQVLRHLEPDDFAEIQNAIEDHILARDEERAAQKKTPAGASTSPTTSPSPDAAAGATSGSLPSTLTSTTS